MAWVEILPRFAALFQRREWDSASSFLAWTGILVNKHRKRQVEQVTLSACGLALADRHGNAKPQADVFYLKKEYAVSWRDRFRNAWHGFGWCATAVREGAMLQALRAAGVGCPAVVALGEDGRRAFVLTRDESAMPELRAILPTLPEAARQRLADALGRELAKMHDAGFDHPDLFAKHILVTNDGVNFRFCILDWQRSRRRIAVPWRLRCRDLAVLDATLHDMLASDRLRLRCLRAYLGAMSARDACPPLGRVARQIRSEAAQLREQRHIREIGQLPIPACDEQFVSLCEGRLLVVRSYFESLDAQAAAQVPLFLEPAGQASDGLSVAYASGPESYEIPQLAHTLFRLQRFGVPAPRLLAVGFAEACVNVRTRSAATVPLAKAFAKAARTERSRMLRQAGRIVRQVHEAGYYLPLHDSWERRLGVVAATGDIMLTVVEPLLRGTNGWQELAPLDFNRRTMRLSRTEKLRFLQGYLKQQSDNKRKRAAATIRILPDLQAWERQVVS